MSIDFDAGLLRSPDWLLAGFDTGAGPGNPGRFHLAQVSRQTYHDSAFLDHRIQPMPTAKITISLDQAAEVLAPLASVSPGWIHHTGFCCSTLLASCLDHPGNTLVLREPLVLSRLAHALRHAGGDQDAAMAGIRRTVIGFCERSYPGETLLVKPSNFANCLLGHLFPAGDTAPTRKAVLMTSGLESLLVSILKKRQEAEAAMPGFLSALLQDSDYLQQLGIRDTAALDLLQQSVLFWHCQRYFLQQHMDHACAGLFLPLSMERFLAEPIKVLSEVDEFLGLGLAPEVIRQTVETGAFRRHSKQSGHEYDAEIQRQEQQATRERYAGQLAAALAWARPLLRRLPVRPIDGHETAA